MDPEHARAISGQVRRSHLRLAGPQVSRWLFLRRPPMGGICCDPTLAGEIQGLRLNLTRLASD